MENDNWSHRWFGHPERDVDIAILPFVPVEREIKERFNVEVFYRYIDESLLLTDAQAQLLDAIETITFIGYPNGVWDKKHRMSVARRGTTATPLSVDYEGTPRFIIDAAVFGGSSGSPVFIVNQGMISDKHGNTIGGSRLLFIGVVAAVFFRTEKNEVVPIPIPTAKNVMVENREMIDLGIVFKSKTVIETIQAFKLANPLILPNQGDSTRRGG